MKTLPHGLAKSDSAADEKEALISAGRIDEAERIQTWGAFHSPVLGSLLQMLDKKCRKRYATDDHPVSLLLYYEREQPNDPFEKLLDIRESIHFLLAHSQFSEVWLYHHAMGHTFKLPDMPDGAPEGLVVRVSLMAFAAPDTKRRVIGNITLGKNHVAMSFDASYTANYGLGMRIKGPPED